MRTAVRRHQRACKAKGGTIASRRLFDLSAQNIAQLHNAGSGSTQLQAAGDIRLGTARTEQSHDLTWSAHNHHRQSRSQEVGSQVSGGGAVTLQAGHELHARAAQINAQGALAVHAAGNLTLEAGHSSQSLAEAQQSTSRGFLSTTTTTRSSSQSSTAQGSELTGQSVSVLGHNVLSIGTRFAAQAGELHIEGANQTLLYATQDSQRRETHTQTQRSTLGITTGQSETTHTTQSSTAVRTELLSDQAVRIGVGERTALVGARVQAPEIDFVRSQDAAPDAAGQLHLGAAIEHSSERTQSSRTTLGLWQQTQDVGYAHSRAQMSELSGSVTFDPSIRLSVELPREVHARHANQPAPSIQAQVEQLVRLNPGLAYLEQLQANPAVQWQALELAQREWNYEQQGLTGAGAALVALAVAWATGGMGAEWLSSVTGAASGSAASAAAMNAGFSTLASQASVSLINHGGDIGRTLRDLGSQGNLQSLIAGMATAGALSSLGSQLHIGGKPLKQITVNDGLAANLGKNVVNHLTRATLNSALTGASLEDSLQTALVSAAIGATAGQVAHTIGGLTVDGIEPSLNPAGAALAHALAGCVALQHDRRW